MAPAGLKAGSSILLRNLGFLGRGRREEDPAGMAVATEAPARLAADRWEGKGERQGPGRGRWAPPFSRRGRGPAASAGWGLRGTRSPLAGRALSALQVHPAPFQAPSWKPPSARGLSLEAVNEAFRKFSKLPVPSTPGVTLSPILPPLQLRAKVGAERERRGRPRLGGPGGAQERPAGPGALGDRLPRGARRKLRLVIPALRQPMGDGRREEGAGAAGERGRETGPGRGGWAAGRCYQGSWAGLQPRSYLNWPLGEAAGGPRPRPPIPCTSHGATYRRVADSTREPGRRARSAARRAGPRGFVQNRLWAPESEV